RHPQPDPDSWRGAEDREERLRLGLAQLYKYYEQTADMLACVLRDAEVHAPTREMLKLRRAGPLRKMRTILGKGLSGRRRLALLDLALDFHTWRRLTDSGLAREDAVEAMVGAVFPPGS